MMEIVTIEISVPTVAPPSNTEGSNMKTKGFLINSCMPINISSINFERMNEWWMTEWINWMNFFDLIVEFS